MHCGRRSRTCGWSAWPMARPRCGRSSPGHTFYVIESRGEKMVACGDLMHAAAVQFADPSVTIQFDTDSKAAAPQRQKLYADAAAKGYYVAFTHVSSPGIGHIRKEI